MLPWWVTFWTPVWRYLSRGAKRTGATVAFVVHNALPHEARWWDRWLLRLALARGDRFVAHAQSEADVIRELFPSKVAVVTPMPSFGTVGEEKSACSEALPESVERAEINLPHPQNKPLLLFCGIIRPYKGLDILLDAMPQVLAKHDVHLAVVGEMWGDGAGLF